MPHRADQRLSTPEVEPSAALRSMAGGVELERWLPGLKLNGGGAVRLFCFPFAGGGASAFNRWREKGLAGVELCGVQYPGRENRWGDASFDSLEAMVEVIAEDLSPLWDGAFAFWGHSFGALIAFELTGSLLRRGLTAPKHLFISGARAPHLAPREPIHRLPDPDFLANLRQYNGMAQEVLDSEELLSAVLPIIRDDFRLFEQYHPARLEPMPIPISVFGGLQDKSVPVGDLLAWSSYTSRAFRCRFFEGHHFFLFDAGDEISQSIEEDLRVSMTAQPAVNRDDERWTK